MYMLMHHLELSHPENGHSPFLVRDRSSSRHRSLSRSSRRSEGSWGEGAAPSRSRSRSLTPSVDGENEDIYVDCPLDCGEAVHIREVQDHMELHETESQASDNPPLRRSGRSSPHQPDSNNESQALHHLPDGGSAVDQRGALLTVPAARSPSRKAKEPSTRNGLRSLFLGPAPRRTRSTKPLSVPGNIKRLGVTRYTVYTLY